MLANLKKAIFIVLAVVCFASAASANEIFMAKNINVDITDKNAEIARRKAMIHGQWVAFNKVINRIVPTKDKEFLPEFSNEEIGYLLKEVSVVKESSSPVRYVATLNVTFDEEKIKKVLVDMGISFVLSASKPYLMVPIYKENGQTITDTNQWQRIWGFNPPQTVLVPITSPRYDTFADPLNDKLSNSEIVRLSEKYGTEGIIFAEANKTDNEIKIVFRKYTNGALVEMYEHVLPIENNNVDMALRKAANYVATTSENSWRDKMAVNVAEPTLMVIVVPLQDLAHLNNITSRLQKIPLIAKHELKAVKQDRAQIDIWHSTDVESLKKGFLGQKMKLVPIDETIFGVQDLTLTPEVKTKSSSQQQPIQLFQQD